MADPPRRSARFGGVQLPPPRSPPVEAEPIPRAPISASMLPEDRELLLGWLRTVHEYQIESRARSEERHAEALARHEALERQVEERDAELERRVVELEKGLLRVQLLDAKFDSLSLHIRELLERDRAHDERLLTLEQRKETAEIAGAAANEVTAIAVSDVKRKGAWLSVALAAIFTALFKAIGDAIAK